MKNTTLFILSFTILLTSCIQDSNEQKALSNEISGDSSPVLDLAQANRLASLPIDCIEQEYPNKLNQTISGDEDLLSLKKFKEILIVKTSEILKVL